MTVSVRIAVGWLAAIALVASTANAQGSEDRVRSFASVRNLAYDMASGEVSSTIPLKAAADDFCYVNTDGTAGFLPPNELSGETLVDWGVMGGIGVTSVCSSSDIVSKFSFGYATTAPDGAAELTMTFYTGYSGFSMDSGNAPVATFAFTGLPGLTGGTMPEGFFLDVDLAGGLEFLLPDGPMAVGFSSPESSLAGDGFANSGPILCTTPAFPGVDLQTGQDDALDSWIPDTSGVATTFTFGAGDASFYTSIARADLSGSPATTTFRNGGTNPASWSASTCVLGGTFTGTVDNGLAGQSLSIVFGFNQPVSTLLGAGQTLLCFDSLGAGELWTGSGLPSTPAGSLDLINYAIPPRLTLCGFPICTQAVQFGSPPFTLSNALDVVIGG